MTTHTLVHNGCSLHYSISDPGLGSGPKVVLVQGVGVAGQGWLPQVQALKDSYTCLTVDNRGFGDSQPVGQPLSIATMADDVLAILAAQKWQQVHLVGHSMGGPIVLEIARRAPAQVASLTLLCTVALGKVATRLTPWLLWVGLRSQLGTLRMRRHAFLQMVLPPSALAAKTSIEKDQLADQLGTLFGRDLGRSPKIVMQQLAALRAFDARPFLQALAAIPTLVVSAEHDQIAPPWAGQQLAAGLAGARFVLLQGASHGVPASEPDRVNALLLDHLRQVAAASGR